MSCCVIAFTGAFGSGCTRAAKTTRTERAFHCIALSDVIRSTWASNQLDQDPASAPRSELQALGDELREAHGRDVLAKRSLESLGVLPAKIVIDSIRNTAEIDYLRERFGYGFTLVGVLASQEDRWNRVQTSYTDRGLSQLEFNQDDIRDRNENLPYGQQVVDCVAAADVFSDNSGTLGAFDAKVLETIDLITGYVRRPARPSEVMMHMAFSASHSSQCLKRHVGAVIADENGQLISVGYNENPRGTNPCVHEPRYDYRCFRDIVRDHHFQTIARLGARCPTCGAALPENLTSPWHCPTCSTAGRKTNLELTYFPDRAMNWYTAIHAEAWALLDAGPRATCRTCRSLAAPAG